MATTGQTQTDAAGSLCQDRPSRLLSLSPELQTLIYEHYYPAWSLVVRNLPISTPSINLLLVSRDVHRLARPVLESSYTGTLDVSLAESCLIDEKIRNDCCVRYRQLLARTHILDIDVSKSPFSGSGPGSRYDDMGDIDVSAHLPGLRTLVLRDAFKCTNVGPRLAKYGIDVSDPDWETRSPKALSLVGDMADKRLNLSQLWVIIVSICDGYRKGPPREDWSVWYKFRMRIEGMGGTYVSAGWLGRKRIKC